MSCGRYVDEREEDGWDIGDESNKRFSIHSVHRFFKLNQQIVFKMLMNMVIYMYKFAILLALFCN